MSAPAELDWRVLPLDGITLIEASAGTGKTYNIALLYLRLLLEQDLKVEQILVTTFTDAAAAELKARIRQRLLDVAWRLQSGDAGLGDASLEAWLAALVDQRGAETLGRALRVALIDIDRAPIATIHGCCRRVLTEFPFEAGAPFVLGEIVDRGQLVSECVEDYWRQRFLRPDPPAAAQAMAGSEAELDRLKALVRDTLDLSDDQLLCPAQADLAFPAWLRAPQGVNALAALAADVAAFGKQRTALKDRLADLAKRLRKEPGCSDDALYDLRSGLYDYLVAKAGDQAHPAHPERLLQHPVILALQPWAEAQHQRAAIRLSALLLDARQFVAAELPRRLAQRRQSTFDALIETVHDRLHGAEGEALAQRLGREWPALLIDEFQDTDRRQWEIFARIHGARDDREPALRSLVLIGDPKQAIYAFRGGDIHTYLAVRAQLQDTQLRSIRCNFRSHPQLLEALNHLYAQAGAAGFADSGIEYAAVRAGEPERWAAQADDPAVHLRLLEADGLTKVGSREAGAIEACASEIAQWLASGQVEAGAVAVLLDTNQQVRDMRRALNRRGVPVVGAGRAAVLGTEWADDVQLLLYALLHLNDAGALRAALATRLLGCSAADLLQLGADPVAWEVQLDRFAQWQLCWHMQGVLAVIESIVAEQAPRLLAEVDGERALTDLRHIGELLQVQAADCFGAEELYARLLQLRSEGSGLAEAGRELQLRIESEAQRVQLLTVHSSKGLEFPIVYLPLAWRRRNLNHNDANKDLARFHDDDGRLRLDLGSPELAAHQRRALAEQDAERMRMLYVGLTRAQHRLHLLAFDDLGEGLGSFGRGPLEQLLLAAAAGDAAAGDAAWSWRSLVGHPLVAQTAGEVESLSVPPRAIETTARQARSPLPEARPVHALYSFTSLIRQLPEASSAARLAEDEVPATGLAALPAAPTPSHPLLQALAAARGPRFGNAVHRLLEEGRGAASFARQHERIIAALGEEAVRLDGDATELPAAIAGMLDRTLDSDLAPGLQLAALPANAQRAEFAFSFALQGARWASLSDLLEAHGLGHWWHAGAGPAWLEGQMKGYIDLVFAYDGRYHVLDYKTNDLGSGLQDYAPDALAAAMDAHHYGLQALLYSVALHRYLGRRLDDYKAERHLGDSWYLFVRALGLAPSAGVWRRRFDPALIRALDRLLGSTEEAA